MNVEGVGQVHAISLRELLDPPVVGKRRDPRAKDRVAALEQCRLLDLGAYARAELEHGDAQADDRDQHRSEDGDPGAAADDAVESGWLQPQNRARNAVAARPCAVRSLGARARRRLPSGPSGRGLLTSCAAGCGRLTSRGNRCRRQRGLERGCRGAGAAGRPRGRVGALARLGTCLWLSHRCGGATRSPRDDVLAVRLAGRAAPGDRCCCWWWGHWITGASVRRAGALTWIVGWTRSHPASARSHAA